MDTAVRKHSIDYFLCAFIAANNNEHKRGKTYIQICFLFIIPFILGLTRISFQHHRCMLEHYLRNCLVLTVE